jgi:hypothetical protein
MASTEPVFMNVIIDFWEHLVTTLFPTWMKNVERTAAISLMSLSKVRISQQ